MTERKPGARQLGLFGSDQLAQPIEPDPELISLRAALPETVRFGTCSWNFEGWKGTVYRQHYRSKKAFVAESLAEYARYPLFRSAEIDRSYYGPVRASELADYARLLPDDFDLAMKVWQELTTMVFPRHPRFGDRAGCVNPLFLDPSAFAEHVIAPIADGFSEHIGPILLSIPPAGPMADPDDFEQRLAHFLARAPSGYRYAVEVRDPRLLTRRYLAVLRDHGAAHIFNFWGKMPAIGEQLALGGLTGPFTVARLMLPRGAQYQQLRDEWAPFDRIAVPQPQMRTDVVALVREAVERALPTYVYVNNKAEGSAPLTIRAIAEALR